LATKLGQADGNLDKIAIQSVADMAEQLGAGQYAARLCPACEGGATRERSMSLDIAANGIVKFYCHRASCDFKGSIYAGAPIGPSAPQQTAAPQRGNRPLTDALYSLTAEDLVWFKQRFGFEVSTDLVKRTETRYALPILSPLGVTRGYITRRPWAGSPLDTAASRQDSQYAMKALTYLESDEPVQSWYGAVQGDKLVLVEDQISAMRLAYERPQYTTCAILGTGINAQKVFEMQQQDFPGVVIALDADATGQAFALARKWGPAFESCRVLVLPCDIKDMTKEQLDALPV